MEMKVKAGTRAYYTTRADYFDERDVSRFVIKGLQQNPFFFGEKGERLNAIRAH